MEKTNLEQAVAAAAHAYITHLDGEVEPADLHRLIIGSAEEALILAILKETGQNQSKTAEWLGLSRNTLRSKMMDYGLLAPPAPKPPKRRRRRS